MNDCRNAEMRDQLPDLLHERLDGPARAVLAAHLVECADCRDELELLRVARGALVRATPRVDLNYVIEALPKAAPKARTLPISRRPLWADWRAAAAAVLLIAGASSYSLLGRHGAAIARDSVVAQVPAAVDSVTTPVARAETRPAVDSASVAQPSTVVADAASDDTPGLGASRLGDLNETQLKALLTEIEQLQPTPITEPDPVTIRVDTKGSTSPEGR